MFEILEFVAEKHDLVAREQYWINLLHASCRYRGFNVLSHAGSSLGSKHTPEAREKMSKARIGRSIPHSEEAKAKVSAANRGRKMPPRSAAHKEKLAQLLATYRRKKSDQCQAKLASQISLPFP